MSRAFGYSFSLEGMLSPRFEEESGVLDGSSFVQPCLGESPLAKSKDRVKSHE